MCHRDVTFLTCCGGSSFARYLCGMCLCVLRHCQVTCAHVAVCWLGPSTHTCATRGALVVGGDSQAVGRCSTCDVEAGATRPSRPERQCLFSSGERSQERSQVGSFVVVLASHLPPTCATSMIVIKFLGGFCWPPSTRCFGTPPWTVGVQPSSTQVHWFPKFILTELSSTAS